MRVVGRGIQEFEKIRAGNQFYVDKTGLIADWYRGNDDVTLITRPRRFGKTLTIDMLNCFFSLSYTGRADLFDGLAISRDREMMVLQGTMPTIRISFAALKADSFRGFLIGLAARISVLLGKYRYLLESEALTEGEKELLLEMGRPVPKIPNKEKDGDEHLLFLLKLTHIFHLLSSWLYRHHGKKPYIFLDEYDTPIQSAYMSHYYDEAIPIMRELFSETFKENEFLGRAVITGITRIAKESLFSDMNNLAVCSVISGGYDRAFGFTGDEMARVLEEYNLSENADLIRFWYDGFTVGRETGIYNPWSVINLLYNKNAPLQDYWAQSGGIGLIDRLVRQGGAGLKRGLETLLQGGIIEKEIREDLVFPSLDSDENAVWSLFIAAGYAKPILSSEKYLPLKMKLCLTNQEAKLCLSGMVKAWFNTRSGNYMTDFARALLAGDLREMNEKMQQVVLYCASSFDSGVKPSSGSVQPENFFHALTLGMLTCLSEEYLVASNPESGFGRYDVSLEPRDRKSRLCPSILEFKVFDRQKGDKTLQDTARRAIRQIEEAAYDADFVARGFSKESIRKYGFGFRGKEVIILS